MAREESTLDLNQLSDDDGFSDNEYSSSNDDESCCSESKNLENKLR